MNDIGQVINAMIHYFMGDARRINHFIKVYGFAKTIGVLEGLDESTQEILEIAAVTHDIGIKNSEKKYNSASGSHQQVEGPPEARKLLEDLNFHPAVIGRICWLIAHHHTYDKIDELDHQILIEADFIVNAFEDDLSEIAIQNVSEKIFKTETGRRFLNKLYFSK
ncbi:MULTISPECIES: HD domain-containing protein [Dehalobacter]|jgi:HD superfamily phosphodiesterase|uniref:HD domain-containing protein n=2 Tax=Dehalobacter restrictus TaxID=55583 RepID=A0A857DMJ6_9FIRM|nr:MULTISPECIES: HD domain-containing protein [Dehalobacter]AHF11022.1 HD family phosphohydrolase [Dehalobacter restrictus DSM 9455]MDJ0305159.1 HD domain-containing protein [Dehalobacter sp.]OCZ53878.1 phosphohydrolase [Dehalobacter sp. TeCB1]QHA01662.1 HD domain-containing protein [Dehalobacter restrictus]